MNVVHLLHKHRLAVDGKNILLLLPEGIFVVPLPAFVLQFGERAMEIVLTKIVNSAACGDALKVAQYFS